MRVRKRVKMYAHRVCYTHVIVNTNRIREKRFAANTHTHKHTFKYQERKLKRDQIVEAITQKMPKLIIFFSEKKKLRSKGVWIFFFPRGRALFPLSRSLPLFVQYGK